MTPSFSRITIFSLFLLLLSISSCEKNYDFEDDTTNKETKDDTDADNKSNNDTQTSKSTQLVIKVHLSASDTITEEEIYPIHVYIMDSDGECTAMQQIRSANQDLEFSLKAGAYTVYAVGGAANYNLPAQQEAQSTTLILPSSSTNHGDLRLGLCHVSVVKNQITTQELELSRRTLQMQSIKLTNIPSDVTSVKLRLQPLYKKVALNGSFVEGSTSRSFTLHPQSDNHTWVTEASEYLFESSSSETILKVMLIRNDSTTTYTYTCPSTLHANTRVSIAASFLNDGSSSFSGTVRSTDWYGTKTQSFNFNHSNNTRTITESNVDVTEELFGGAPERGTLYKGCFVLRTQNEGDTTIVTLLTPKEENKIKISQSKDATKVAQSIKENTKEKLNKLKVTGIKGWRLPTLAEMVYVEQHLDELNEMINLINTPENVITPIERNVSQYKCGYFFNADDGYIYVYEFGTGVVTKTPSSERATYKVRGFTTMKFSD